MTALLIWRGAQARRAAHRPAHRRLGDVLMHARSRKPLQDTLTATRLKLHRGRLRPGAGAQRRAAPALAPRLAGCTPEVAGGHAGLAGRCSFSLAELRYEYPREIVPAGHTPTSWLRTLTEEGAAPSASRRMPAALPAAVRAADRARARADRASCSTSPTS
jgi:error-prone DNA polymerase